ncbi:MAG: hypothetical protein JF886_09855 [Candidatus Dormibacteraeota bacterium]|uniref:Photosynthesis system II assembly factor Ycf48/Hcf136-like domain-containing protein n=1 Tax=Candidatus Aeolococcus gillhamiae TaxID=3127015 RepID=A0A934K3X5_9BACT|nr:hypothetical protein [Candidatus Dormibacteraeota bacterium]
MILLVAANSRGASNTANSASASGAYVGGDLHSLVVNPSDPREVFVGGHQSAAVSHDGGRSFQQVTALQNADAMSWSMAPDGRTQVVAGHGGLRTSIDGGTQWTDETGALPATDVHAVGLDPAAPTHLVAYLVGRGIFTSTDFGRTWNMVGGSNLSLMGPILVSPGGRELIAADMMAGIVHSEDGGASWSVLSPGVAAMWLSRDPTNAKHLLLAGNGLGESVDGGVSWRTLPNSPPNISAVAVAPDAAHTWFSAALDGDHAVVYTSADSGARWQAVTTAP